VIIQANLALRKRQGGDRGRPPRGRRRNRDRGGRDRDRDRDRD
jgi:hypothetical protein